MKRIPSLNYRKSYEWFRKLATLHEKNGLFIILLSNGICFVRKFFENSENSGNLQLYQFWVKVVVH
jgi:hypothetical protein